MASLGHNELTHWPLVMPYGIIGYIQHWFRQWLVAWQHQAITFTNVDQSLVRSCDIHLRAILQEFLEICALDYEFENYQFKITVTSPRGQWVYYLDMIRSHAAPEIPNLSISQEPVHQLCYISEFSGHDIKIFNPLASTNFFYTFDFPYQKLFSLTGPDKNVIGPWHKQNGQDFTDDIFRHIYLLIQVPKGPIDNKSAFVKVMAWCCSTSLSQSQYLSRCRTPCDHIESFERHQMYSYVVVFLVTCIICVNVYCIVL